jgi:hypothetical protein
VCGQAELVRIKVLTVTKRFMMIFFISIQNPGRHTGVTNRRDPLRFEVVNNQRTSHPIFN